jgi:uncharacterized protein (DUF433 family)
MVAVAPSKFVGLGMYTPAEAAMYARLKPDTMRRWVHGDGRGAAAMRSQMPADDEKTVTFLDFVQSFAIRAIRDSREGKEAISLQKIRESVEFAHSRGVEFPFARKHATYLFDHKIWIDIPELGLTQATGDGRGQHAIVKVVEPYLELLMFDESGLAREFLAYESLDVRIVMRPDFNFGEPFVERSGQSAWTLWDAWHSEGGVEQAARAYGATPNEVRVAYRYIDSIRPATAA